MSNTRTTAGESDRLAQAHIDELLRQTDIVTLIGERIRLQDRGSHHTGACPFHTESAADSLVVDQQHGTYACDHCEVEGSAIGFLMVYEELSFFQAIAVLAERAEIIIDHPRISRPPVVRFPRTRSALLELDRRYQQDLSDTPEALVYLADRGVTAQQIACFSLGYARAEKTWPRALTRRHRALKRAGVLRETAQGEPVQGLLRERIVFPIRDEQGQTIGFGGRVLDDQQPKYLNTRNSCIFEKGRSFYGQAQAVASIDQMRSVVVVEGYFDVIALHAQGMENTVAPLGTTLTTHHAHWLIDHADELVFCFDGDAAGRRAAQSTLETLSRQLHDHKRARFVFLPEGWDPDSYVRRFGIDAFHYCIDEARWDIDVLFDALGAEHDASGLGGQAAIAAALRPLLQALIPGTFADAVVNRLESLLGMALPPDYRVGVSQQGSVSGSRSL